MKRVEDWLIGVLKIVSILAGIVALLTGIYACVALVILEAPYVFR